LSELDPLTAPSTGGDLHIIDDSPALEAGDNNANSSPSDLEGDTRIQGQFIDLGAYEGVTPAIGVLFLSDYDNDGNAYGYEMALGTDPNTADLNNPRNLTAPIPDQDGNLTFSFGRGNTGSGFYIYTLSRSTTLDPHSFVEIFRFPTPNTLTLAPGVTATTDQGFQAFFDGSVFNSFTITDEIPLNEKAFYRLSIQDNSF